MASVWSPEENELTVSSYLDMLTLELHGERFVKAHFIRALHQLIPARSEDAIQFKFMNVSAVLHEMLVPCIEGFKPYSNYQADLYGIVERQLARRHELAGFIASQVEQPPAVAPVENILAALVNRPPPAEPRRRREQAAWYEKPNHISPTDYLEREARNMSLGAAGEEFVILYEQARLVAHGSERLAAKVERVSVTRGPAAGFDVLSFDVSGRDKLIEVKTTRYGPHTPFFITGNEVTTSDQYAEQYSLYRLFAFERQCRLFILSGPVRGSCSLSPALYLANLSQD